MFVLRLVFLGSVLNTCSLVLACDVYFFNFYFHSNIVYALRTCVQRTASLFINFHANGRVKIPQNLNNNHLL